MTAATVSAPAGARRVLIIDDEPAVLRVIGLLLERNGFAVASASNARDGLSLLAEKGFDVVLSDIIMPELSGLDFLRELRQHDLDVPVILMTAGATLDSALDAIEYGASQYLLKPVEPDALITSVGRAAALGELARMKRTALAVQAGKAIPYGDRQTLEAVLTRTFATIRAEFQPVVSLKRKSVLGYEALMRCDETLFASYGALLIAAERIGWRTALSKTIYQRIAQDCSDMPEGALLFVNIHPLDAQESLLTGSGAPLEPIAPSVVLDVRESVAGEQLTALAAALPRLRGAGFRIAIDNVGTGTTGLDIVGRLAPDFAKLDRSAYAGIEKDATRQRTVRAIYAMFASLDVPLIAEGVESAAERDALLAAGADLAQGNLFGAPSKRFETPAL
jgi:EAL domain-containing protein (putative c-di-GMP-specific phosphodiesterase class I)/ActR/RegA family two-component response regulator